MKLFSLHQASARPDVLHAKHMYGMWFGVALGLTFSIFAWGIDAYILNRVNGLYPWLKFLGGAIPCMLVGGFTGWLSARFDRPFLALLFWAIAASFFAWLTVSLPLQITPRVLGYAEPGLRDLLHYTYYESFSARFGVAYAWLAIFVSLAGLLQIPLSDSGVFATSIFGKISPMLFTLVIMAICGTIIDNLNNELLRSPIDTLNTAVQYVIDHEGQQIPSAESRRLHLAAFRPVQDLLSTDRKFIVSGYDQFLEEVQVLARFDKGWVECTLITSQLISCEQVGDSR